MSSTPSSPSSRLPRTPLHERSSSDKNKLAIRIVPYSPPRIDPDADVSQAAEPGAASNEPPQPPDEPIKAGPSRSRDVSATEGYATSPGSALSSPSSSSSSLARVKGKGVSGPKPAADSSEAPQYPGHYRPSHGSHTSSVNASSEQAQHDGLASPTRRLPKSRRDNVISVHSDKTFSVVLRPSGLLSDRTAASSLHSPYSTVSSHEPPASVYSTVSSHGPSFDARSDDRPSSPPSSVGEPCPSPYTLRPPADYVAQAPEPTTSSPWNYRMVGGLRKVPSTPEPQLKDHEPEESVTPEPSSPALPPLPEVPESPAQEVSSPLAPKPSFTSEQTDSTESALETTTNYKIVGRSSPPLPDTDSIDELPSSSDSNYRLLGESSPPPQFTSSPAKSVLDTPGSKNYVVHSGPNYQLLGESSPLHPLTSSPVKSVLDTPGSKNYVVHSGSNYQFAGESSPPHPLTSSPVKSVLDTPGSKNYVVHSGLSPDTIAETETDTLSQWIDTPGSKNFIVHGQPSPTASSPLARRDLRPQHSDDSLAISHKYSQESLVIPPLHPRKKTSYEQFLRYAKSKESLRRASSFSSISSVISQDTANLFLATPNLFPVTTQQSSWAGPSRAVATRPRMDAHPHQWSSQLSTVLSEDEGSEGGSRALSAVSIDNMSRSSAFGSRHSRQMLSISSSMAGGLDEVSDVSAASHSYSQSLSHSRSGSGSLERPGPAYLMRGGRELPASPEIRDHDEHGDGLAELHQLRGRSSRTRLGGLLSPRSSDRDLHSSASSRAGSITSASIPAWARLYYGSGERRWLSTQSIRSYSDDSRPTSSWAGRSSSPTGDQFPPNILSPRKRPREMHGHGGRPESMEITPVSLARHSFQPRIKRQTSSVWSPHLRFDKRASRYSIWEPPSVSWSAESGMLGRRNIQIVLFVFGFVFPFSWMIAALLPLPPVPITPEMAERDRSTTMFGIPEEPEVLGERPPMPTPIEESRYQSARWWRNLNRVMAVFGLLIIGAIIALVVVGLKQNWMHR